jgi:hypothetical protein
MTAVPRGIAGAEVVIVFTIIASFTLVARLYTRYVLVKNPGREELAIIFAWVCSRYSSIMIPSTFLWAHKFHIESAVDLERSDFQPVRL